MRYDVETTGQVEQQATEEQIQAAMQAGFDEAVTGVAPTETPAQTTEPAAEPAPQEAMPEAEPVVAEEPVIAGYKESELRAKLAKLDKLDELDRVRDSVRGDYGGLKKAIEELRAAQAKPATTDSRLAKMIAKLEDEFPEMFADIPRDEHPASAEEKPAPVVDQAEVDRRIAEATAQIKAEADKTVAIKLIDFKHPDRMVIKDTPEFKTWVATLPANEQDEVWNTWDANVLSAKFDAFKEWNTKRLRNAERLKGAVTPKGVARAAPATISDEQAMKAGFDSVFQT